MEYRVLDPLARFPVSGLDTDMPRRPRKIGGKIEFSIGRTASLKGSNAVLSPTLEQGTKQAGDENFLLDSYMLYIYIRRQHGSGHILTGTLQHSRSKRISERVRPSCCPLYHDVRGSSQP
eukprot:6597442-Pyramimonas_sp.AAC.1